MNACIKTLTWIRQKWNNSYSRTLRVTWIVEPFGTQASTPETSNIEEFTLGYLQLIFNNKQCEYYQGK